MHLKKKKKVGYTAHTTLPQGEDERKHPVTDANRVCSCTTERCLDTIGRRWGKCRKNQHREWPHHSACPDMFCRAASLSHCTALCFIRNTFALSFPQAHISSKWSWQFIHQASFLKPNNVTINSVKADSQLKKSEYKIILTAERAINKLSFKHEVPQIPTCSFY